MCRQGNSGLSNLSRRSEDIKGPSKESTCTLSCEQFEGHSGHGAKGRLINIHSIELDFS